MSSPDRSPLNRRTFLIGGAINLASFARSSSSASAQETAWPEVKLPKGGNQLVGHADLRPDIGIEKLYLLNGRNRPIVAVFAALNPELSSLTANSSQTDLMGFQEQDSLDFVSDLSKLNGPPNFSAQEINSVLDEAESRIYESEDRDFLDAPRIRALIMQPTLFTSQVLVVKPGAVTSPEGQSPVSFVHTSFKFTP